MTKTILFPFFLFVFSATSAQRFHVGLYGGLSAYNGDLTQGAFQTKVINGVIGVSLNYEITDNITLRGTYNFTRVGGADRFNKDPGLKARNLSFETKISEFALLGEYYLVSLHENRFSPYGFLGIAMFKYDPYAFNGNQKVYLRPLSTEGQGLAAYPDRKPYNLTQVAIPFGIGAKYALTDRLRIGAEFAFRKTFTDYLDDVSTSYIDPNDLLAERGQLAVDMSYRGDEVGNPAYPDKGKVRGVPKNKDVYYFLALHLTYGLGDLNLFGGGSGRGTKGRGGTACPVNVY